MSRSGRRLTGPPKDPRVPWSEKPICGLTCEDRIFGECDRCCLRPPRHRGGPHTCGQCEDARIEWKRTGVKPDKLRPSAAAVRRKIEAFTIVGAWLLDTGCPDDMVSRDMAVALSHFFRKCIPKEWHSANGSVTCDEVLPIAIDAVEDKNAEVHIMQDTPALLSIGKRVVH